MTGHPHTRTTQATWTHRPASGDSNDVAHPRLLRLAWWLFATSLLGAVVALFWQLSGRLAAQQAFAQLVAEESAALQAELLGRMEAQARR